MVMKKWGYIFTRDTDDLRECSGCGDLKPHDEFRRYKNGFVKRKCRKCESTATRRGQLADPNHLEHRRAVAHEYRQTEHGKQKTAEWNHAKCLSPEISDQLQRHSELRRQKWRLLAILKYGAKCNCCGENQIPFLCFDHVHNDGKEDRQQRSHYKFHRDLVHLPIDPKYQLLCFNCNMGKAFHGGICPHRQMIKEASGE